MTTSSEMIEGQIGTSSHLSLNPDTLQELAQLFGVNILQIIIGFATEGEDGSRLTLQKNRDGFTVQATGAVHKSEKEDPDNQRMLAIREMLAT